MKKRARRAKGAGGLYQRKDGMWVGTIDLGWTATGTRRRKVVYHRTQAGALAKLREIEAIRRTHGDVPTSGLTVEAWLTRWLDQIVAAEVKPRTLAGYRSIVRTYLVPVIGRRRLDALTPADVRAVHQAMGKQSSTTVLHAHNVLHGALRAAEREGLIAGNVASRVKAPRKAEPDMRALTADQAVTLLRSVAQDPLASRWLAALTTGARQGELLGLRWSHVDLEAGVLDLAWSLQRIPYSHGCQPACGRKPDRCPDRRLTVPRGLPHRILDGNLALVPPKTAGSTRVVPMTAPLVAALTLHRDTTIPGPHGLVWDRGDGRPIDGREDFLSWKAHLKAAGLPEVPLHAARHTTATLLLELGVDARVIASILGHSDVVTTRGYQHVSLDEARRAVEGLGRALTLPSGR